MGFLGVYSAVYDYQPQGEGELEICEGDLLYILEKNADDDWWKAKKKAEREDEDEPEGLVPNNYVEEVSPSCQLRVACDVSVDQEQLQTRSYIASYAHWIRCDSILISDAYIGQIIRRNRHIKPKLSSITRDKQTRKSRSRKMRN